MTNNKLTNLIKTIAEPIDHNGTPSKSNVQCVAKAAMLYEMTINNIRENINNWNTGIASADTSMGNISAYLAILKNTIKAIEEDVV